MANMHGFFRASAGPGWALVGDAGHFKDPTPGQGIADALRQAEKLAGAIERALGGGARRDPTGSCATGGAGGTRTRGRCTGSRTTWARPARPRRCCREAQRRIAADPELRGRDRCVLNHDLRPSEVFTPAFSLTTLAHALRRGRGQRRAILHEAMTTGVDELRRRRLGRRTMPTARATG